MFNRTNALILLIAIAGAIGGFLAGGLLRPMPERAANPHAVKIGDTAPAVQRPDVEGKPRSFDEWHGKLLVLVTSGRAGADPAARKCRCSIGPRSASPAKACKSSAWPTTISPRRRIFSCSTPVHYPILIDDPARGDDVSAALGNDNNVLPYTVLIGSDGRVLARRAGKFSEATLDAWLSPHL